MLTTNNAGGRKLASVFFAAIVAFSLFIPTIQPAYAADSIVTVDRGGSKGDMGTVPLSPLVTVEPSPCHPVPAGVSITLVQTTGQVVQSSTGSASNAGSNNDKTSNDSATDESENAAEPEKEDSPFNSLLWIALCLLVIGVLAVAKTSFITRLRR